MLLISFFEVTLWVLAMIVLSASLVRGPTKIHIGKQGRPVRPGTPGRQLRNRPLLDVVDLLTVLQVVGIFQSPKGETAFKRVRVQLGLHRAQGRHERGSLR
ncbi:hypothetical protein QBC45DRAFT_425325 [Copromyces sp. CBS 386.78]|nr:hypothetical protein QBC45DRAFT_425325 [Copromyces sp. CBS 386.78]